MTDSRNYIDCHIHLFGDVAHYPVVPDRTYTPTNATLSEWRAISEPLGIRRAVLVQPSAYGTDNTRLIEGLQEAEGSARGIAVIDESISDETLQAMHVSGVRGVRLNLATGAPPDIAMVPALLRSTAARIGRLGWHIQVFARGAVVDCVAALIPDLEVPVMFDHLAGAHASLGLEQPGLQAVLGLLRNERCWVKLSGADHAASQRGAPEEALPIMRALVEANPDRLVWGSDWPHVGKAGGPHNVQYLPVSHEHLLNLLRQAAGGALEQILTRSASVLYQFG